jgi:Carboxypeptidase regulatory-like domain
MRSGRRVVLPFALLTIAGTTPAAAQTRAPAVVRVRVTDVAGTPIANAELAILAAKAPDAVAVATTDTAGRHEFTVAIDGAAYRITARKLGYVATIRRLRVAPGDTTSLELRLAAVAAVQRLPTVVTRETYRLDLDPGVREGFRQRCASPIVACVGDSTLAEYPSGDLLSFLNRTDGIIPQPDNGFAPHAPKMYATFGSTCEPTYYVNGFRWGLRWADLAQAYRGFAVKGIEVYRAGQPRPGRFSGEPSCGVIVFWLK